MQSYIFDFDKSPTFFSKWNKKFDVESLASATFNIVLVDVVCEDNIQDCLDSNGNLKYTTGIHVLKQNCGLKYVTVDDDTSYIALKENVVFSLGLNFIFRMKGIFITTDTGYVMGSSINPNPLNITNSLTLEKDLKFWTITEGDIND